MPNNPTNIKDCVHYLNHMGDDLMVVNAARVSFNKFRKKFQDDDEKLIKYLADHHHWTPFSHPQITLKIKMPIPIARQYLKSMVGMTINEVSRRYVSDEPELFYVDWNGWRKKSANKKQGSDGLISEIYVDEWNKKVLDVYDLCLETYRWGINTAEVCPEQARMVLPQSMLTEFWQTASLYYFARVCNQRTKEDVQLETQEYAKAVAEIIEPLFPVSWKHLVK